VSGSGGIMGSGGLGGGGTAAGGRGGAGAAGGATGSGGSTTTCAQYAKDYEAELPSAKKCNVQAFQNECTVSMPSNLTCSGDCGTYVASNSSSKLKAIYSDWQGAGCDRMISKICECKSPPTSGSCDAILTTTQSSTGDATAAAVVPPIATTGVCTDRFGGPAPL